MNEQVERELRSLEHRRCTAISAGDVEALAALLSDDYVHVHMNAALDDRTGHLNAIAKRPRAVERGEILIRVYGESHAASRRLESSRPRLLPTSGAAERGRLALRFVAADTDRDRALTTFAKASVR